MKARYAGSSLMLFALLMPTRSLAQSGAGAFVTFDVFLSGTAKADAATYLGAPESRVANAAEFETMRRHVLSLYEGVQVTHSFVYNAQYVDCVPVLQQPSARRIGLTVAPQLQAPALPAAGTPAVPATPPRWRLDWTMSLATAFRATTEPFPCAASPWASCPGSRRCMTISGRHRGIPMRLPT